MPPAIYRCPLCSDPWDTLALLRRHVHEDHEPATVAALVVDTVAEGVRMLLQALQPLPERVRALAAALRAHQQSRGPQ